MGFTVNGVEFLAWAKREGVRFERTMTLGRQQYVWLTPEAMRRSLRMHGLQISEADAEADMRERDGFAGATTRASWRGRDSIDGCFAV